jgi:hypothetical protein
VAQSLQEGNRTVLELPEHIQKTRLISDEYRRQQTKLHENPDYGTTSKAYAPIISKLIGTYGIGTLLDYGCGKQLLARHLEAPHSVRLQMYDPAIEEYSETPEPCEMVCCIDVLEHIEPNLLDNVLDDLKRVTERIGLFTVCCEEAVKVLDDGRNAHLTVEPPEWWLPKIMERFDLHMFQKRPDGFMVLVMNRGLDGTQ